MKTLLLLHGALGAQSQFAPLRELLRENFDVHALDFEGHGEAAPRERAFTMQSFAEENVLRDESFQRLPHRIRVGVGDRDSTVSVEESAGVFRLLPQGELQVFPATPHPLEKVSVQMLASAIEGFFA